MKINKCLRKYRLQHGYRQKDLAEHINKSIQAYNRYELGSREVSFEILNKIANFYNYPVSAFFINDSKTVDYSDLTIADLGTLFVMRRSDFSRVQKKLEQQDTKDLSIQSKEVELLHNIRSELERIKSAMSSAMSETTRNAHLIEMRFK